MRDKEIRILCYGDSNTWGYISGSDHQRYTKEQRWTGILQNLLGSNYCIIEEGLCSRTFTSNDERPGKEGKNGYDYLIPCLDTHDPIDLVILMLGTNELKYVYDKTPEDIGNMLEEYFVKTITNRKSQMLEHYPKLLIVTPPIVNENTDYCKANNKYVNATLKSKELNTIYKKLAKKYDCFFLGNEELTTGIDGVHLTKESHQKLAELLNIKIKEIYNKVFQKEENEEKTNIFILHSLNGDTLNIWGKDVKEEFEKEKLDVFLPEFPIRAESTYENFSEILKKYFNTGKLNKNSIVICHSIGNPYFIRFCKEENYIPKAYIAVAPGAIYNIPSNRNDYIVKVKAQAYCNQEQLNFVKKNMKVKYCLYSDEDEPNKEMVKMFLKDTNCIEMYLKYYNHFDGYHRIYKIPELNQLIHKLVKGENTHD